MKSILVPVEEHVLIHSVLETALRLGRALDGYLEGMAITPNMPPQIASDIAIGDLSFLDPQVRRERAGASRRLFETFMAAQRVPRFDAESTGLSFGWRREDLEDDDFVGSYGRAFDIIVLGRPSNQPNHPRLPTISLSGSSPRFVGADNPSQQFSERAADIRLGCRSCNNALAEHGVTAHSAPGPLL
jgi:hypothetical protein